MEVICRDTATADQALAWQGGSLWLLDQRRLPQHIEFLALESAAEVAAAIRAMVVRGAPAIGIAAAYGVVLAVETACQETPSDWRRQVATDLQLLSEARPTAVNLAWALRRMERLLDGWSGTAAALVPRLLAEAQAIHAEDIAANRRLGELGAALIERRTSVITHCNAGALATGGYGTALGVIRSAHAAGRIERVFADETRPWLQGARLTAWELVQEGIPVSLMADGAAASRMRAGGIGWVIVGADRIAANGDVANKIGTYGLALAARYHGVRFMVAAPSSSFDLSIDSGADIPIEERDPEEVLGCGGHSQAATGAAAWNPVFDITPAELVEALVTERGVILRPNPERIARLLA